VKRNLGTRGKDPSAPDGERLRREKRQAQRTTSTNRGLTGKDRSRESESDVKDRRSNGSAMNVKRGLTLSGGTHLWSIHQRAR